MDTKNTTSPKTLQQAIIHFSDPDRALACMVQWVWPNGVVCPHCDAKGDHHFIASRRIWRCAACKQQFSIKLKTIMEDSPIGLDKWLCAIWLIGNAKNGISSCEIHRALGITQKSAWFMLHRIRHAMKTGSFKKASGIVEADEGMIGGKVANFSKAKKAALRAEYKIKNGNHTRKANLGHIVKKSIVMGLLERARDGQPSQVRTEMIESRRRPHIQDVVRANVEPNSILMTDELKSYQGLQSEYIHMAINHAIAYAKGKIHTNSLENFWSLLERTIKGTYVACEPWHLSRYLDEQAFRFNHRKMTDSERFAKVLGMVAGKRLTLAELTGKSGAESAPA